MKTLIFNGSPRKNGGTATLINNLKSQLPGEVIIIDSYRTDISPCVDCRHCWTNEKCAINDEMQKLYYLIDEADNIVIASPIYFAELTGSLLSLMSRLQYLWVARKFRNTEVLSPKKRNGALVLVDAGDGAVNESMAMGKRLLRIMEAEFAGSVYFSGTDNVPEGDTTVPEHILAEIKKLSIELSEIPVQETDEERRTRIYPVILSEYNPAWPEWFAEEKANLERLIGAGNIVRISHIGSTAVPGLLAKPTVDIQLDVKEDTDIEKIVASFQNSEYICLYPPDIPTPPPHLMVLKGYTPTGFADKVFHIHFRYPGDDDRLIFRDYLIAHTEAAAEYAALKRKLFNDYEHNRDGYTYAKDEFVNKVMKKAEERNYKG